MSAFHKLNTTDMPICTYKEMYVLVVLASVHTDCEEIPSYCNSFIFCPSTGAQQGNTVESSDSQSVGCESPAGGP